MTGERWRKRPLARDVRIVSAGLFVLLTQMSCGSSGGDSPSEMMGPALADIAIEGLTTGDRSVRGTTTGADPETMRVVLYAKTDQWYVQPFRNAPFTAIMVDGTWSNSTHPWNRLLALLVDESYEHRNTSVRHPASAPGVLAWDEYPEASGERTVRFSDRTWIVKTGDRAGPGPNYFSDAEENVWVDGTGLHLQIVERDGRWNTSEVFLPESLGYGTYQFTVASLLDRLDGNAVFAGFVYESADREIDIEFSPLLARPMNAQYVVQPYTRSGNLVRFDIPGTRVTSHRFDWRADRIEFTSWEGDGEPTAGTIVSSWVYTGPDIPPAGGERMHFNLWLFGGDPPVSGVGDHVIIRDFRYVG